MSDHCDRDITSLPEVKMPRPPFLPTFRNALIFLLAGQGTLLLLEWFNRSQGALIWWPANDMPQFVLDLLLWPAQDPLHWSLNFLIVLMVLWLLTAITGRMRLSVVLTVEFYLALGIVNHLKMSHLGMPLSTGDVTFAAFAAGFMLKSWGIPRWTMLIPLLGTFALGVWMWRRRKPAPMRPRKRLLWGTGSLLIALLLIGLLHSGMRDAIAMVQENARARSHVSHNQEIGLNLLLAMELIPEQTDPAIAFSEEDVEHLSSNAAPHITTVPSASPHVIFWLSESFWDPTLMPDVKITPDPLANYRSLCREGRGFNLLVPTFGGFTSRTMFEMVTGLTNAYVAPGRDAFTHVVSKAPCISLARLFSARGYETVAVRAGMGDLFAGQEAYNMLGFDHYDTEDSMPHAARVRGNITDQALSEYVVQRVETSTKPMFMFLASIQNHAPFEADDYSAYHVHVMDPTLNIVNGQMMSYIEGVYEADQALAYLLERFEHDGVPVVVVFYGDHLPGFTNEFAAAKFFPPRDPMTLEQIRRKYTTPGLIWTNTPLRIPELAPEVSPQAVIAATLQTMNIQHSFFTGMLGTLVRQSPAFSPELVILADGTMRLSFPDTPAFQSYERLERSILERHRISRRLFPEGPN